MAEKECYDAQRMAPFLATPISMFDNKHFMKWFGTAEAKLWHLMFRYVVRGSMITKLNKKLYEEYYEKGILAMYKEHKILAEILDIKSRSHVTSLINDMINRGIVIPHKDKWRGQSITVYQLGVHDMSVNNHESLFLYNHFSDLKADETIENFTE